MDLDALGQFQWGLVTWRQLLERMTEKEARLDIAEGRFIRKLRSIYRMAGVPESWEQGPMAAFLAVGGGAAAGLCCAGRLLHLPSVPSQRVELVVPEGLNPRLPSVLIRRSNFLPLHHVQHLDALAVTTPARSICDMSAKLSAARVGRILRAAIRNDLTTYDEVWKCREELRARGRRRTTVIDEVFENVISRNPGDSEGEHKVLKWIASAGLPMPTQQFWVTTAGGRFCLDGAYVAPKIDLEWDSDLHEKTPEDVEYDAARDIELELVGWLVMRASRVTKKRDFLRRLTTALETRSG